MTTALAEKIYLAQHLAEHSGRKTVVFNPSNLESVPAIYAFSNVRGGGDGICYAMAADGTVLGSHWCSHEAYAPHDLGVTEGAREDRHEDYRKHYPDGYAMQFVRADDVKTHPGLIAAFALNQQQAEALKATETSQS